MTPPYRPPAIKDIGLKAYLDNTQAKHNDSNYAEFKKMVDSRVSPINIARVFNVNRRTIHNWLAIYREQ